MRAKTLATISLLCIAVLFVVACERATTDDGALVMPSGATHWRADDLRHAPSCGPGEFGALGSGVRCCDWWQEPPDLDGPKVNVGGGGRELKQRPVGAALADFHFRTYHVSLELCSSGGCVDSVLVVELEQNVMTPSSDVTRHWSRWALGDYDDWVGSSAWGVDQWQDAEGHWWHRFEWHDYKAWWEPATMQLKPHARIWNRSGPTYVNFVSGDPVPRLVCYDPCNPAPPCRGCPDPNEE